MAADRELLQFFGKRLRTARHAAHLSQMGLARRLQLGQDTISHYEGGHCRPDLTTLARLAEVLGVSITYFFPDGDLAEFGEAERETLALLKRMSPTTASALYRLIQHCAEAECHNHVLIDGAATEADVQRIWQRWLLSELQRLGQETPNNKQPNTLLRLTTLLVLMSEHSPPDVHPRAARRLTSLMQDWMTTYIKEPA
jgi:transcriptional regulator with XRE-family HTH domain